ncbi:MAG: hypothetical protein ACRDD7_18225 [Peptostreptococcaceae bacterium]
MRNKCNQNCGQRPRKKSCGCNNVKPTPLPATCGCNNTKPQNINCNNITTSNDFQKCEMLAAQSRELYEEALCYNKKIEKFNTMAAQAECRAKQLEEEARNAWCEYNEFIEKADEAAQNGERAMKASCKLLQESQECFSHANSSNGNNGCNDNLDFDCGCGCNCTCNCGCR